MAREISDFDGSVTAVSATYPYGDIKDNPSGTRINSVSNSDIHQLMQRLMEQGQVTPNGLADNATNGFQLFEGLQGVMNEYAKQIIISMFGQDYSSSEVYVLSGCANRAQDGYIFYDGEIYFVLGQAGPACGGGLVDILFINGDTNNGLKVVEVSCDTSGVGISDFADIIYFSSWVSAGSTVFTAVGGTGSVTVDPADVIYNKYLLRGKTVTYQLTVNNASVLTGTILSIDVSLPFLSSNLTNTTSLIIGGFSSSDGVLLCALNTNYLRITPISGSWSTGTNNKDINIDVTFEIV